MTQATPPGDFAQKFRLEGRRVLVTGGSKGIGLGIASAMATLYFGSVIGVIYFLLDLPGIGKLILAGRAHEGFGGLVTDPAQGLGIPLMLVGPLIAVLCVIIYMVTSLLTPATDPQEVAKVCWDHPLAFLRGRFEGASDPRAVTLILLGVVGVLYFLLR